MNLKIAFKDSSKWFDNYKILINSINFFYNKTFKSWSKEISEHTKLPENEIEFYVKKKIFFYIIIEIINLIIKRVYFFFQFYFYIIYFIYLKFFCLEKKIDL